MKDCTEYQAEEKADETVNQWRWEEGRSEEWTVYARRKSGWNAEKMTSPRSFHLRSAGHSIIYSWYAKHDARLTSTSFGQKIFFILEWSRSMSSTLVMSISIGVHYDADIHPQLSTSQHMWHTSPTPRQPLTAPNLHLSDKFQQPFAHSETLA